MTTKGIKNLSRKTETREKVTRKRGWVPPSNLDAPEPPEGFHHRWVRSEYRGQQDEKNVIGRIRSGYELVRADEYPEQNFPSSKDGKYAGVIGVGGLLLARIPEEIAQSREAYFAKQTKDRDDAVNNDLLKEQHKSMPITNDSQARVTFGGTKK